MRIPYCDRDCLREGNERLTRRLTFLWSSELSTYDAERGGFHVAIGPKLIQTRWGIDTIKAGEFAVESCGRSPINAEGVIAEESE